MNCQSFPVFYTIKTMQLITVYLDWNIFNKIEALSKLDVAERDIYRKIEDGLLTKRLIAPYSNAHISDLVRGYLKNPDYIDGHLQTLKRLTNNICIAQYWGETKAKWHLRDVKEFFEASLRDKETQKTDFYSLFDGFDDSTMGALAEFQFKMYCEGLKRKPMNPRFKEVYKEDTIFTTIYPRTKEEMTEYAFHEDLFALRQKFLTA